MERTKLDIAAGYATAALFTNGVDGGPGEYEADTEKVAYLSTRANDAAGAFLHLAQPWVDIAIERGAIDAKRIGQMLHYEREGHGISFTDEGDDHTLTLLSKTARLMGEDSVLQDLIMGECEAGNWYSDMWSHDED